MKKAKPKDAVNHPPHYNEHPSGVECIEITEHMPFNVGSAVKYLWRADHKHESPIEDLKKAAWYIQREIQRLSGRKRAQILSGSKVVSESRRHTALVRRLFKKKRKGKK